MGFPRKAKSGLGREKQTARQGPLALPPPLSLGIQLFCVCLILKSPSFGRGAGQRAANVTSGIRNCRSARWLQGIMSVGIRDECLAVCKLLIRKQQQKSRSRVGRAVRIASGWEAFARPLDSAGGQ